MGVQNVNSCRFVRGARTLAYLLDMSQVLRSVRLASHPTRSLIQRFLGYFPGTRQLSIIRHICEMVLFFEPLPY